MGFAGNSRAGVWAALALGALAVAAYLPALSADFLNWDDDICVTQNAAVTAPDGLRRIWSTVELPAGFPNYPLVFTSYWLENRLWGLNPVAFHAGNALLHGVNTALASRLLLALGASPFVALGSALLFAVHPVQVESVAWVSERKNLMSATFDLLAFLAFLRFRVRPGFGRWAATFLAFAAALLSKTTAVVLPLSMLAAVGFAERRWRRSDLAATVPLFALAGVAGLVTLGVEARPFAVPVGDLPFHAAAALWFYVGKLLLPLFLLPLYPQWHITWADPTWWPPLLGLVAAALLLYRDADWRVRWGAGHFVLLLLPYLGLRPYGFNTMSWVADHNVYLACLGFFLVALTVVERLRNLRPRLVRTLAFAVPAALVALTLAQERVWTDSVSLWTAVLSRNPDAAVACNNLGHVLTDRGRPAAARPYLEKALALSPESPEVHNNLGRAAFLLGDLEGAEASTRRAVELNPDSEKYRRNLAAVLKRQGRLAEAEAALRAVPESSLDAQGRFLLGQIALALGRRDEAQAAFRAALALDPAMHPARNELGRLLLAAGRDTEAAAEFGEIVRQSPQNVEARYNLSVALERLGRRDEAIGEIEAVLELRPDFDMARVRLRTLQKP